MFPDKKNRWKQSVVATFIAANLLFKVRFRRAKIVRNLFQKVLISVPKVSNLGRFKKDLAKRKKWKVVKIIAEIPKGLVLFWLLFSLNMIDVCIINECMGLHGNLALNAQLTYKQNEKQYYKCTLCSSVVWLLYCRSEKLAKFNNR